MSIVRINKIFSIFLLLVAVVCIFQPVLGANGTVTIAYRGSGGSYIGDTVIFDGQNTVGNVTFLRVTGPGLPAVGVPIYDLNGAPGSGNPVEVNPDGTWKFVWYTSNINGVEKMQTARYYFTAADLTHPDISSTTSVVMKKEEFYASVSPNPAVFDNYVSVTGSAERGVSYVRIDVADVNGKIYRTYTSPVSASGYFNYGFHVDMAPGQYYITVSNPSIRNSLKMVLTIISSQSQTPVETVAAVIPAIPVASIPVSPPSISPQVPVIVAPGAGTLSIASTPADASVYLDSVLVGKTPVDLGNLDYGSHLIEVKTPGYQSYSIQVNVTQGAQVTISPFLLKNPAPIPLSPLTVLIGLIITGSFVLVFATGRKDQ